MKNQPALEQGMEREVTLKSWTVPVVEVHEVEQLTMTGGTSTADGGVNSS